VGETVWMALVASGAVAYGGMVYLLWRVPDLGWKRRSALSPVWLVLLAGAQEGREGRGKEEVRRPRHRGPRPSGPRGRSGSLSRA
jgi:hypothetical protein